MTNRPAISATLFVLLACALLFVQQTSAQNAENGKRLFVRDGCYECHGYAGQGGAGVRIAPNVLPLVRFIGYLRKPSGVMPPYTSKVASDSELADIRAYLATIPEPPAAKNIPLLNQ